MAAKSARTSAIARLGCVPMALRERRLRQLDVADAADETETMLRPLVVKRRRSASSSRRPWGARSRSTGRNAGRGRDTLLEGRVSGRVQVAEAARRTRETWDLTGRVDDVSDLGSRWTGRRRMNRMPVPDRHPLHPCYFSVQNSNVFRRTWASSP